MKRTLTLLAVTFALAQPAAALVFQSCATYRLAAIDADDRKLGVVMTACVFTDDAPGTPLGQVTLTCDRCVYDPELDELASDLGGSLDTMDCTGCAAHFGPPDVDDPPNADPAGDPPRSARGTQPKRTKAKP